MEPLLHWRVHRQRPVGCSECWAAGWALQGLPAAHGQRIHDPLAKGADQRVDGAPFRAVSRDDHSQARRCEVNKIDVLWVVLAGAVVSALLL